MQRFNLPFLIITIICALLFSSAPAIHTQADPSQNPLPPPVEIEFTTENTPRVGEELILKLKVTTNEDMHAEISCLLPEGIELVRERGVILRPYRDRRWQNKLRQTAYRWAVELWIGPLKANIAKEFTFRIIIPDKQRYELITHVEALAKWGIREETLVINID